MASFETKVEAFREALKIVIPENKNLQDCGLRVFETTLAEAGGDDEAAALIALDFVFEVDWARWRACHEAYYNAINQAELNGTA